MLWAAMDVHIDNCIECVDREKQETQGRNITIELNVSDDYFHRIRYHVHKKEVLEAP